MSDWPADWGLRLRGVGCAICAQLGQESIPDGERFFAGSRSDAYLRRDTAARGYSVMFWRGRHVAEPTDLTETEWRVFASELRLVAVAIEAVFRPAKLNIMLLGNSIPHLHAHVVPRYFGDPNPEYPPLFMLEASETRWDDAAYAGDVAALRTAVADAAGQHGAPRSTSAPR